MVITLCHYVGVSQRYTGNCTNYTFLCDSKFLHTLINTSCLYSVCILSQTVNLHFLNINEVTRLLYLWILYFPLVNDLLINCFKFFPLIFYFSFYFVGALYIYCLVMWVKNISSEVVACHFTLIKLLCSTKIFNFNVIKCITLLPIICAFFILRYSPITQIIKILSRSQ